MRYPEALALSICLVAALGACGKHHGGDDTNDGDGGVDFDSIALDPAQATIDLALGASADQAYTVHGMKNGVDTDITARCALTIDGDFGIVNGPVVTVSGRGGKTTVNAICGTSGNAAGSLIVNLHGEIIVGTAPATAPATFAGATLGTDANRAPHIEYPLDQAVSPKNIPPVDIQWSAAANDLFHTTLTTSFMQIDVYTTDPSAMLDAPAWGAVLRSAGGDKLGIAVEGLATADPTTKFAAAPVSVTVSQDNIDQTAIYYWASSASNLMSENFGDTAAPTVVQGNCTACHSLSRSGSRIGYSRCTVHGCQFAGFMKYDGTNWTETVNADNETIQASYSTFAPVGNPFPTDDKAVALMAMSDGSLHMYDPDTGTQMTNTNLATVAPPSGGALTMPDWSWDGTRVVAAKSTSGSNVDPVNAAIVTMTYSYDATTDTHTFGPQVPLVTGPYTLPTGSTYNNLFFPSFAPDGRLIVFNAARANWRNNPNTAAGSRLMIAGADGSFVTELAALNGPGGDTDITWAHWAPNTQADYYWLVFSSEHDYGHRVTAANHNTGCDANGVTQCKQIWIAALRKDRITGATTLDPSAPPMWLPGQDTQTDNISPFWTQPASISKTH